MFQRPEQYFELTDILWLNYRFLKGEIPQTYSSSKGQFRGSWIQGLEKLILRYIKLYPGVHREGSMGIFRASDLVKILQFQVFLESKGFCNTAKWPLYFTPKDTILTVSIHICYVTLQIKIKNWATPKSPKSYPICWTVLYVVPRFATAKAGVRGWRWPHGFLHVTTSF